MNTPAVNAKPVFELRYVPKTGSVVVLKSGDAALMNWYKTNQFDNDPMYSAGELQVRRQGAAAVTPVYHRKHSEPCTSCDGSGWKIKSQSKSFPGIKCKTCRGTGKIRTS